MWWCAASLWLGSCCPRTPRSCLGLTVPCDCHSKLHYDVSRLAVVLVVVVAAAAAAVAEPSAHA